MTKSCPMVMQCLDGAPTCPACKKSPDYDSVLEVLLTKQMPPGVALAFLQECLEKEEITLEEFKVLIDTPLPRPITINAPGGAS